MSSNNEAMKPGTTGSKTPRKPIKPLLSSPFLMGGAFLSIFLLPYKYPSFRNSTFGILSSVLCTSIFALNIYRPKSSLMELADGINTNKIPDELQEQIDHVTHLKSIAKPPPTPAEEIKKLNLDPSPRFCVNDPELMNYLDTYGYVVVNLQVEQSTINELRNLLWSFLEDNFKGWKRSLPDTWNEKEVDRSIWAQEKGIIFGAGIGHSEFLWRIRTLKGVKEAFSRVWGDDNLITSFDGANIFRPWNTNDANAKRGDRKTNGGWWHVDQGKNKTGKRHAVQGLVSLYKADETTGGLCVMPKTHNLHTDLVKYSLSSQDYVTVQPYFPGYADMERKLVCCEAGDLILWDSRTIHCNTPAPNPQDFHEPNELLRAVGYVCMTPHKFASEEILSLRREAYNYKVSTSHWPHEYHPGSPADEGKSPQDYRTCDQERKELIG